MAEFLTRNGISGKLEKIIREADKLLVIISPYIKVDEQLKGRIERKSSSGTTVRVIYGKRRNQDDYEWLQSLASVEIYFCEHLHAKCYLNESEALLASMNLYEYSMVKNYEMGILVSKAQNHGLYGEIIEEAEHIAEQSKLLVQTSTPQPPQKNKKRSAAITSRPRKSSSEIPTSGFCIRCRAGLPANPRKPYCSVCFEKWDRYHRREFKERHCHICGNEHSTSFSKPVCRDCYRVHKDQFEFTAT